MGNEFQLGPNGSFGKIDFDKLKGGIKKDYVANDDKLQKLFSLFDTNNDGTLSRSEIEEIKNSIFDADGGDNGDKIFTKKEAKNFVKTKLEGINNQAKEYTDSLFKLLKNIMTIGTEENLEQVILNEKQEEVRKYKDGKTVTIHEDGTKTEVSTDKNGTVTTRELDSNDKQKSKTITKKTSAKNNHGVITTVENYDENNNILNSTSIEMKKDAPEEIYSTSETTYIDKKPAEETITIGEETSYSRYEYSNGEQRKIHYKTVNSATGEITEYNDDMTEKKVTAKDGTITEYKWDSNKNDFTLARTTTVNNGKTTVITSVNGVDKKVVKQGEKTVSVSIGKDTIGFQDGYIKGVIVQNGESISKLATKFNCTKEEIINANNNLVKYTKEGYAYFLVGQEIKIPNKYNEDTYANFIEANKERQSADEAKQAYEFEHQPPENKGVVEEVPNANNSESDSIEITELPPEIMQQIEAEFEDGCRNIADTLLTSYDKAGTDDKDFNTALAKIKSPEILEKVEALLVEAHSELGGNENFSPIELVMKSEKNRIAARSLYKQMINNGAFTPEKAADIIEKELEKVLKGATSFDKVLFVVEMIKDKAIYDALETQLHQNNRDLAADEGSYIRALIKADGFTQEEIDRLDAILLGAGAYAATENENGETNNTKENITHKTDLINRVMGYHDDNNDAIHKLLGSIETDEDIAILGKYAKEHNYTSVDDMLQQVATTAEEYVAFNNLYYKDGKPYDVQVTEAIKLAKEGDLGEYFKSSDWYFYMELAARTSEIGYNSLEELYNAALQEKNGDNLMIKSNAILYSSCDFSEDEILEHCKTLIKVMETAYETIVEGNANLINKVEDYKLVLKSIISMYPGLKDKINAFIDENVIERRKDEYLNMINSARYVDWSDNKYVDKDGNEITDPKAIAAYQDRYEESLSALRKYVTELEREFNLMRDAQGRWSRGADNISKGTGIGTDSFDVERMYREAKDMLDEFEAAINGQLRDADGNSVNPSKLAEEILAKIKNVNDKYGKTIEYTKMAMVLAPIIAVSGGFAAIGTTGATALGAGATLKTVTGIVSSAIGAGVTDRLISADEMNSSITGRSQEAKDRARNQALTNAGFVLIGGSASAGSSALASKIAANVTSKLATGVLNLGKFVVPLAADIAVGATTETILTGEVTVEGMTFVVAMSMTGHLIGYKRVEAGKAKTKVRAEHAGAGETGGTPSAKPIEINNQIAKLENNATDLNKNITNLKKRLKKAKNPQAKAQLEKQLETQQQRLKQIQDRIAELKAEAESESASQPEQVEEDVSEHAEESRTEENSEGRVAEEEGNDQQPAQTNNEAKSFSNDTSKNLSKSIDDANLEVKGLFRRRSRRNAESTADNFSMQIRDNYTVNHTISKEDAVTLLKQLSHKMKQNGLNTQKVDGLIKGIEDGSIKPGDGHAIIIGGGEHAKTEEHSDVRTEEAPATDNGRQSVPVEDFAPVANSDVAKKLTDEIKNADLADKGFMRTSRRGRQAKADSLLDKIKTEYENGNISREEANSMINALNKKIDANNLSNAKTNAYKVEIDNPASEASRKRNLAKVKKLEQELEKMEQEWNDIPEDMKQAKYPEEYFESDGTYKPMKEGEYTETVETAPWGSERTKRVSNDGTREEILNEKNEIYSLRINGENGGNYYLTDGNKVFQINLDSGYEYYYSNFTKNTENGFITENSRKSNGVTVRKGFPERACGESQSQATDKYMSIQDEQGHVTERVFVRGDKTIIIEKTLPDGTIECTTMEDGVIKKVEIYDNNNKLLKTKYDSTANTAENSAPAEGHAANTSKDVDLIMPDGTKVNLSLQTDAELQTLAGQFKPSRGGNGPYELITSELKAREYLQNPNDAAKLGSDRLNKYKNASWLSDEQRAAVEGGIKICQDGCNASLNSRISSLESELTLKNKLLHFNKYSQKIENLIDDIALYKNKNWITQEQTVSLVKRLKEICIEKGWTKKF